MSWNWYSDDETNPSEYVSFNADNVHKGYVLKEIDQLSRYTKHHVFESGQVCFSCSQVSHR